MNNEIVQKADQYFKSNLGVDFSTLMAPIDEENPSGRYLRSNGVYSAIKDARKEDDATLPMGAWEHELKRADWDKVTEVVVHALANKTKDLQLVAWLLEAQLHKSGFNGIFASFALMESLCKDYWNELYPPLDEDGDLDYRLNILHWINLKLQPLIKQIPITNVGRDEREYHWADWEKAKRNEQLKQNHNAIGPEDIEGIRMNTFMAAMAGTSTEHHRQLYTNLDNALLAMEELGATLDDYCGDESPSLNSLGGLLEEIQALVSSELYKRGVRMTDHHSLAAQNSSTGDAAEPSDQSPQADSGNGDGGSGSGSGSGSGVISSRADAYAQLSSAADYLIHLEPHSPVPYLVKRAVEWGNLNTSELYHKLFVQDQGQISIFDLVGIELEHVAPE